uniref:16S rRNA processing protein RimM domain containing protein n=2 Tax=Babesia bovis TaxID=5865 RepID=A7APB9_BABBO|eukprot:XP_001611971.1 16S rRNA processing protein RimM domain containing protein [Babesia bovis T2Bo]
MLSIFSDGYRMKYTSGVSTTRQRADNYIRTLYVLHKEDSDLLGTIGTSDTPHSPDDIKSSDVVSTSEPSQSTDVNDPSPDEPIDPLVVPNKYYQRSKYSKVGFKEGLKRKLETDEERMARTFNIFAPMPKEAMINPDRKDAPDISLIADINKNIKHMTKLEKQKLEESRKKKETVKTVPPMPLKVATTSRCPNAILIDKSTIFSTPLDEYIVVGKILSPHGLKGHVKVMSLSSCPDIHLCQPGYKFLKIPYRNERVMPIKIEYGRLYDGIKMYRLKLEGVDTRDQAIRLNGAYLSVSIRDVPPLQEDCYYSRDLLDMDLYLFNDNTKTRLGKVIDFCHREDLVSSPKYANITEDLLEVEMDLKLSIRTMLSLTRQCHELAKQQVDKPTPKGVSIVTDHDLETADNIIDAEEELVNSCMTGVQYVKYYTCSICNKEFTNHDAALEHDRAHEANAILPGNTVESTHTDLIHPLDEKYEKRMKKPIRRFYIPLIKDETVKFVDVPNKSIYVDVYTIFIGDENVPISNRPK